MPAIRRTPPLQPEAMVTNMSQSATPTKNAHATSMPRGLLIGAAGLIGFALIVTAAGRISGVGVVGLQQTQVIRTLPLKVVDRDDGSVVITHADEKHVLYVVQPGQDGFIRATLRGFVRERKRSDISDIVPFTLTHWSNGTLTLSDSTTGRRVSLEAFGSTNTQAFAQFFAAGRQAQ
jgi:putative photosynthetic complex assembly protein